MALGLCCSAACEIFPDQGSSPCPLNWQADQQVWQSWTPLWFVADNTFFNWESISLIYYLFRLCWISIATWASFSCRAQASLCRDFSCCGAQALECACSTQLSCSRWDLSSRTRDQTHVSCIGRQIPNQWTTREVPWCAADNSLWPHLSLSSSSFQYYKNPCISIIEKVMRIFLTQAPVNLSRPSQWPCHMLLNQELKISSAVSCNIAAFIFAPISFWIC